MTPSPPAASASATAWHLAAADEVLAALDTSRDGLSETVAARRLEQYGPNALTPPRPASAWAILARQLQSVVALLLVAAVLVALASGDRLDAVAIGAVLALNTLLGFVTELRARRALEALLGLDVQRAVVVRDGLARQLDAHELVPGDVIELEAGQAVPADARLIRAAELRTVEATLTGESVPVDKRADETPVADAPLAERTNMVYKGTTAVTGRARGVVIATGMATEVGRIGTLAAQVQPRPTLLERRLDALGRRLVVISIVVAAVVAGLGLLQQVPLAEVVQTGIALAVAAVPEGLPAVATITMALGVHRMARRRALVRRLPAVESLGSATVVCTDKTGTLTAGEMTVTTIWVPGLTVEVSGAGYAPEGKFSAAGRTLEPAGDPRLDLALRVAALASRSRVTLENGRWVAEGDPTDAALLVAARKAGLERAALLGEWPEVGEIPFSSERMFMASVHRQTGGAHLVCAKGAPGRILDRCGRLLGPDGEVALDDRSRGEVLRRNHELAAAGLRVIALAVGREPLRDWAPADLTFVALVGLLDPPAPGVHETIQRLRSAGIRTVLLTGDQRLTALAVARSLGVIGAAEDILEGSEIDRLSDAALAERIARVGGFSRVSPEAKLRIIAAYQARGEVVAMLGDGVNDAAALRQADIGVAMGRRGTDVAKEAADLILQDDRFETIAAAVEEGRVILDNIRKSVFYLFSCNLAEILVFLGAGIAGLPAPLRPLQLLWLNLVTDTFPALALALEPAEPGLMRRPARDPRDPLLSGSMMRATAGYAALICVPTLLAFAGGAGGADRATTLAFMTLALAQIFHLGNARSRAPVTAPGRAVENRYALGAVALSIGLQLLALHVGPLARVLDLRPLSAREWLAVAALGAIPAVAGQAAKMLGRRRRRPRAG